MQKQVLQHSGGVSFSPLSSHLLWWVGILQTSGIQNERGVSFYKIIFLEFFLILLDIHIFRKSIFKKIEKKKF